MKINEIESNYDLNESYKYFVQNKDKLTKHEIIRLLFVLIYGVLELSDDYVATGTLFKEKIREIYNFGYEKYKYDIDFMFYLWRLTILDESYFSINIDDKKKLTDNLINHNLFAQEMVKFGLVDAFKNKRALYCSELGMFAKYCNQYLPSSPKSSK